MIVNAAVLADVPAKRHALEEIVAEDEIARVISLGEEAIFFETLGADGVANNVVLDVLQREFSLGDSREALDPVFDFEFFRCDGLRHTMPPNLVWDSRGLLRNYSAMRGGASKGEEEVKEVKERTPGNVRDEMHLALVDMMGTMEAMLE
jgi:hypothetical protein